MRNKIGRITTKVGSGATPKGGASAYQPTGMPLIRSLNVHNEGFRSYNLAFINDDHARQLEYASVEPGDVLLNITGASILRSAVVPAEVGPARVNQHVSIVRPDTDQVLPGYLHAWLISPVMYSYMYSLSVGSTREAITKEQILRFPIVFPTLEEQRSIISYLESKTAAIDGIIGKLQREVELLERYRRELIAHTVTRGLNPDVPMKDSGIDWIGKAPASWKAASISVVTDENKAKNADLSEKNLLSLSYGRIIRKDIDLAFGLLPASFDSYQIVEPGYIVLRMTDLQNDKRSLRSALANERGIITSAYIGLKVRGPIVSEYFAWLLRFYDLAKVFYSLGGGVRQSASYKEIGKIPILVPPLAEQQKIADFLEEKSAQIDSTIEGINKQIELLGKYRKQVINDAVTGKVRVEEVA
nr:restriction endonuclease subunit S [Brevibacterium sp. ACRRH]